MNWLKKIAAWFQPTYDSIEKWDLPPEIKAELAVMWAKLPAAMQVAIWKMIASIAEKYGDELAQKMLIAIIGTLKF